MPDAAGPPTARRRTWLTVLKIALALLALALLVASLVGQWSVVRGTVLRIGFLPVVQSFAWAVVGLLLSALAWREGLAALGHRLPLRAAYRMFFVSQVGKYLPGSVWPILAQMEIGRTHGVPRPRSAVAGVLFLVLHLTTGLVVALATLPFVGPLADSPYAWFGWLVVPALVLLAPPVLTRVLDAGFRLVRRPPLQAPLRWGDVLRPAGFLLVMWLAYGASLLALLVGFGPMSAGSYVEALGAYALAWSVGFVIVVVPAGIGVREAILVLVFAPAIGVGAATAVAALLRLTNTAGDLVLALASGALGGRRAKDVT